MCVRGLWVLILKMAQKTFVSAIYFEANTIAIFSERFEYYCHKCNKCQAFVVQMRMHLRPILFSDSAVYCLLSGVQTSLSRELIINLWAPEIYDETTHLEAKAEFRPRPASSQKEKNLSDKIFSKFPKKSKRHNMTHNKNKINNVHRCINRTSNSHIV